MAERIIKTIYLEPGIKWTGHHVFHWMAYLEGDEHSDRSPRGLGQTQVEAVRALEDKIKAGGK